MRLSGPVSSGICPDRGPRLRRPRACRCVGVWTRAWTTGRRCLVDLDDLDLAADEARAFGLTAGDDLEFVIGRAGNAIARITAAFARGVDLGPYTVEAATLEENTKELARRGQAPAGAPLFWLIRTRTASFFSAAGARFFLTATINLWVLAA